MTKNNAHLYLPLVQALAEGKTIQVRLGESSTRWVDRDHPQFDLPPQFYRIKPEPIKQEFYYIIHKISSNSIPKESVMYGYNNRQTAEQYLKTIDPKGDTYMIMHAKAVEILD